MNPSVAAMVAGDMATMWNRTAAVTARCRLFRLGAGANTGLVEDTVDELDLFNLGVAMKVRITSLGGMLSVGCRMATHRRGCRYASR